MAVKRKPWTVKPKAEMPEARKLRRAKRREVGEWWTRSGVDGWFVHHLSSSTLAGRIPIYGPLVKWAADAIVAAGNARRKGKARK